MTKPRNPNTIESAMLDTIRALGAEEAAKAIGRGPQTLRDYSDASRPGNITLAHAIRLDQALILANATPYLFQAHAQQLGFDTLRDARQQRIADWCVEAFGAEQSTSLPQRGIRLLEESIELAQAAGCTKAMCLALVDHIFKRPVGALKQEAGGVGVTLIAFCAAANFSADEAEKEEVARVLSKPIGHFTERNRQKNDAGFLAVAE